jgi:glycosyltransferase involved in cell wall biosynthesis
MQITVIIPTYNRAEILRKTLEAYGEQIGEHKMLEVLVVDDGSDDHTAAVVDECSRLFPVPLRYLYQANAGLAAARNNALREAQGDLILLGDDDIIPSPRLVAEHVDWHKRYPQDNVGVLGYVPWSPHVRATPFMKWSGLYGPQFNFGYFKPGAALDFQYGYFCNTSVKVSFLKQHGTFSEAFRTYGYEDIELSYRLSKKGYTLLYNPEAVGYHNKYETLENAIQRVEKLYQSWPEFAKTEAGARFLELWRAQRAEPPVRSIALMKRLILPIKAVAVRLLRPLVNTHLPLPNWLYSQIFYQYVTSFAAVVGNQEEQ